MASDWELVVGLCADVERHLAATLHRDHGLALSDFRALCRLSEAPEGELRMNVLAESLRLNQSSVSRLVARLERAGLSRRDVCSSDLRGVYTVITSAGHDRIAQVRPAYETALQETLHDVAGDTPRARWIRRLLSDESVIGQD